MITASGIPVYPGSGSVPTPEDIAIGMCRITRYAGARWCPLAAHSILVAELLYLKTKNILHWSYGLLHDAHETITGEVTAFCKPPALEAIETALDRRIFPSFGLQYETYCGAQNLIYEADKKAFAVEATLLMLKDWEILYEERSKRPAPTFTEEEAGLGRGIHRGWTAPTMILAGSPQQKTLARALRLLANQDPEAARRHLFATAFGESPTPIPMILLCPLCRERHIDRDLWATKPHKTHLCEHCGAEFRPALVPTVGVGELP